MTEISSDSLLKADDKKTTPEPKPGDNLTSATATASHIGDGAHHDTSGGGTHETSEDAFRAAIGLETGNRGSTSFTTEQFNREVGQGAGISRGQVVKYTDADGTTIQGGQYHNKEGTFFKTPEGDTYKVQTDNGRYTLQPTRDGQQPIEATQRDVVSNNFGRWGNQTRPEVTTPAATTPEKLATAVPAAGQDKVAAVPTVATDKQVVAPATVTAPGADHSITAPATPGTGTKLDPATFYNTFKGATDQQQRDLLTSSLSQIPKEQRPDFIKQVTEVAITTDRANAGSVLNDLRQTAREVRSSLDNPSAIQPVAATDKAAITPTPAVTDKSTPAPAIADKTAPAPVNIDKSAPAPATINKGDLQPVVQPGQPVQPIQQVGQISGQIGGPQKIEPNTIATPASLQQIVKGGLTGGDINPPVVRAVPGTGADGQLVRPGDVAKITAPIDGAGNKITLTPGGGDGLTRGLPGQPGQPGQPGSLDAAGLIQKLQNPGGQPGDKLQIGQVSVDVKQLQPVQPVQLPPDLTRGHGGDGKDNPGAQIAARGVGGDQPQPMLPQQKIPGLDLNDAQTRQFLADALKQIQATKVGDFDPRSQSQNLQDILKGFDPQKIDRLQAFLNPDGKGPITDAAVGKLAFILAQPADRVTGTAATDITLGQRMAIDRLTDLVRNNQNLIDLQTMQTRDVRLLQEINRLVGDVNKQFGLVDGKAVLTLGDIIGRSLDGTRGGERGLEGRAALSPTNLDPLTFTARLTPQQEQAIRALLDMKDARAANLDTHLVQRQVDLLGKNDPAARLETNVKSDLAARADTKHEPTARELAVGKEVPGKEIPGKEPQGRELSGKELPGKELPGRDLAAKEHAGKQELTGKDLPGKQEMTGKDLGNRTELGVKGELITRGELANRPDQIVRPENKESKDERGDKLDPHSLAGKHDNSLATNLDGSKKIRDEKELAEKQKDEKERLEEEQQRRDAAMMALMADRKLREDKEKQQKEQEKLKERKQDEDSRRRRYVVRERDTLESIATKQHRDAKLAPLIHEINKKEIAMKVENGREVPDLRARQVIWLPSEVDIREFRKRLHSGSSAQSALDGKLSAEDELTARFGANWSGSESSADTAGGEGSESSSSAAMTPEAMAAAQARRANIENLLGPLSKQRPADGRIRYVVRLGDTLKTVAMKHPSLQDISLWPLLAEINEISVETDDKGTPLAKLSRGSTVMIPTVEEIQHYRDQHGVKASSAARATKSCPHCGRLSAAGAAICGACAHSFNLESKPSITASDAGMVVMQAAGFVQKPGVPLAKRPAPPETTELEPAPLIPPPLYDENAQLALVQLDDQTRLTRCMIHGENPSTVVIIEVCRENSWNAVVAYEIFSQSSMRHEYHPRGDRKSVRIDLPTEAILELSNNDLKTNWKNYRDRYFAQLISLNR